MAGGHRRDCPTAVSYFGSRHHHAVMPSQPSCESTSHGTAQKPRSRDQSCLLPENLQDSVQHARLTAFCLIHMNCTHSSLPSREQQLWCPPLFYISIFVMNTPPGWLKGDETPSVPVSPLLIDTTRDIGSSFEEQDMDNTFQQTQEPECHPPGGGENSQTENFQDALSLRGYQSRIRGNTS